MQIAPSVATDVIIEGETSSIEPNIHIISSLVRTKKIDLSPKEIPQGFTSSASVRGLRVIIPLPEELQEREKQRLQKEQEKLQVQIVSLKKQLSNPNFLERAPAPLVTKTKNALSAAEQKSQDISDKLSKF